jgi:nucleotide-binding universal stress UspA family protein
VTGYRNILVAVGPLAERSAALKRATTLALRDEARLTIVSAAGSPPALIWLSPGLPENPFHSLERACERRLRSLARAMPPAISVTTRLHHGGVVSALLDELRYGSYDLVVVGSDQHRRWRWPSRLSRALLRRSPVSILIVAPNRGTEAGTPSQDAQLPDKLAA